ncbi:hypothetical protein [Oceanobacillus jeddahense]|nr:hypothetical protein [Oceanobacillus jeddahense]
MNGLINSNTENNERGLLPYPIILAANKKPSSTLNVCFSVI